MLHYYYMATRISATSRHHPLHTRRRTLNIPLGAQKFLAAFEGFEGGFAIGSSIVVALMFSGLDQRTLVVTAIITIIVNGFNNASVKYSSEHYLDELDGRENRSPFNAYFIPSFIEFVSYFAISFISIVPLLIMQNIVYAVVWSVIITVITLAAAGWWRGYMLNMPRWRDAIETAVLGTGIILVGALSGWILNAL